MYLMATSTEFVILKQRIDSLEFYSSHIITGITLTITILLALFALVQFIYQQRIQEDRIKSIENKLKGEIEMVLRNKEEELKKR